MIHSARTLATSRSSLASKEWNGARRTTAGSGERKEHLLQSGRGLAGLRAQLSERAGAADASFRQQHEAVADARGIAQLVDGENERAPIARDIAQYAHDLARLPQVEAVERLVHQQQRMGSQQGERQHEPSAIALRQCGDALAQDRRET